MLPPSLNFHTSFVAIDVYDMQKCFGFMGTLSSCFLSGHYFNVVRKVVFIDLLRSGFVCGARFFIGKSIQGL
jgi:hypothetical protein